MFIRHVHLYTKCGEIVYTILCIHDNFSNLFAYIERNPFRSWHCIEHWRNIWILSICPKNKTLKRETFNLQNNISIWVTLPTLREFWARAKLKKKSECNSILLDETVNYMSYTTGIISFYLMFLIPGGCTHLSPNM